MIWLPAVLVLLWRGIRVAIGPLFDHPPRDFAAARRVARDLAHEEADRLLYAADPAFAIEMGYEPPKELTPVERFQNRALQNMAASGPFQAQAIRAQELFSQMQPGSHEHMMQQGLIQQVQQDPRYSLPPNFAGGLFAGLWKQKDGN